MDRTRRELGREAAGNGGFGGEASGVRGVAPEPVAVPAIRDTSGGCSVMHVLGHP
jgi:hypothetical protein